MHTVLENNPIIAAVITNEQFEAAVKSGVNIIFMLKANLVTVGSCIEKAHKNNKMVFVHIDMAEGIGKDSTAILFLKSLSVDGIISTRGNLLKIAHENDLKTVQRVFIVDSHSIETSIESIKTAKPDMIEIMPGIVPKVTRVFSTKLKIPVIAGGLITEKKEVIDALKNGATAISTSNEKIWEEN